MRYWLIVIFLSTLIGCQVKDGFDNPELREIPAKYLSDNWVAGCWFDAKLNGKYSTLIFTTGEEKDIIATISVNNEFLKINCETYPANENGDYLLECFGGNIDISIKSRVMTGTEYECNNESCINESDLRKANIKIKIGDKKYEFNDSTGGCGL